MGDHSIRNSLVFAGLFLAIGAAAKVTSSFGVGSHADLSQRALMAMLGVFLVFTGNTIPKQLAPLSARCDPARAQAIQRLAGWTWVLTGLALAAAWLALPVDRAGTVTLVVVPIGILLVAVQVIWLRRPQGERSRT